MTHRLKRLAQPLVEHFELLADVELLLLGCMIVCALNWNTICNELAERSNHNVGNVLKLAGGLRL